MKGNIYVNFVNEQEKRINSFPKFFAFNEEQFNEGMVKLGIKDKTNLLNIGYGGFIHKKNKEKYLNLWKELNNELKEKLKDDTFLYQAFKYELSNHEYIITYDFEDTLDVFNMKYEELSEREKDILEKAKKDYIKCMEKLGY